MRFKLGIAVGFAAGYYVATMSPEERRAKLDDLWSGVRENPRMQRVTDTVARDARRLGDAVEQRVVRVADGAVGAVAGTVGPSDMSEASDDVPGTSPRVSGTSSQVSTASSPSGSTSATIGRSQTRSA